MRRWLNVLAAGVALTAGCKLFDRERDRDRPAEPASRTKGPPKGGRGWLDGPTPGLDKIDAPAADSWAHPKDPGFDVAREVRGVLAGFVEDPDGRKLKDVFIEVEPADATAGGGAPVGVQTDKQGYFSIKGLKPKLTYVLTARTKADGAELAGRVYAQTGLARSQHVRLTLIEGLALPGGVPPGKDLPLPGPSAPPVGPLPAPALPEPAAREGTGLQLPPAGPTPPSARPELTAEGPAGIWKPPTTSIPPTVTPPRSARKASAEFTLIDPAGEARTFPSGRAGDLVLLDFLTTTCVPCKKAIPVLKAIQEKYGARGVEVVGVVCDEAGADRRRSLAAAYRRAERLNYPLYVEPGASPGAVQRRFDVEAYPTLVLLDGTGEVLWQGHARDAALDRAITAALR